jgi:hypothetical protein
MPGEAHTKVRMVGTLGPTAAPYETFSTGFAVKFAGEMSDAVATDLVARVRTFFNSAGAQICGHAILRDVQIAHIAADGHQDTPTRHFLGTTQGGAPVNIRYPTQVALAVSLRGPAAVKPKRGRLYLPMPGHDLDLDTGAVVAAQATATANAFSTLVNGANTNMQVLGAAGAVIGIDTKDGVVPVREVRVGKVFDTIRSRRRDMLEAYLTGSAIA